jgi:hypothetical protein
LTGILEFFTFSDEKTIVLNYSEAEYLLALLSISYDTSMEIKEAKTISKINKFKARVINSNTSPFKHIMIN